MDTSIVIREINNLFQLMVPEQQTETELQRLLAQHINHLIQHDFNKLISILYRMDVHEHKLKKMLQENGNTDAADIIATLIIERENQKIKSRQEFSRENLVSDEERW